MSTYTEISFTQVPMGTIIAFGLDKNYIPEGWLLCDGTSIPQNYKALRDALGSNLPDLRARTLIGTGTPNNPVQSDGKTPNFSPSVSFPLGNTGGEYKHQLTKDEMPKHGHKINNNNFWLHYQSFSGSGSDNDFPFKTNGRDKDKAINGTDDVGGDLPHNTMQPYYVVNYIIYAGESNI